MKQVLDELYSLLGSPSKVAFYLQYSDRNLRKIRNKVDRGEELDPRVEFWIKTKRNLLNNASSLDTAGK